MNPPTIVSFTNTPSISPSITPSDNDSSKEKTSNVVSNQLQRSQQSEPPRQRGPQPQDNSEFFCTLCKTFDGGGWRGGPLGGKTLCNRHGINYGKFRRGEKNSWQKTVTDLTNDTQIQNLFFSKETLVNYFHTLVICRTSQKTEIRFWEKGNTQFPLPCNICQACNPYSIKGVTMEWEKNKKFKEFWGPTRKV